MASTTRDMHSVYGPGGYKYGGQPSLQEGLLAMDMTRTYDTHFFWVIGDGSKAAAVARLSVDGPITQIPIYRPSQLY